jgi:hypothetical protein
VCIQCDKATPAMAVSGEQTCSLERSLTLIETGDLQHRVCSNVYVAFNSVYEPTH